ncbi:histidyl-tRNA synthetase [Candidatus Kinetoplastibacterium blastocrithidii TCC012E]|uniref:Histidine--tRNA ligase n=1 Tax=Candidatus Kinetoplastidibacterium blastocrithidiae TCC012E TaxID=1208922 RepID=M1MDM1_9PROT|nr:histidine--tRNA ligase [Candidatus Kinetoplastibacterium blastocrithidii]AFZ83698.1 histidyl-tRNA synthetase [Candidatus Kinetoplastibacterium blastocrithidii (ex Strigomonas culicis)]AGF49820.1 histidyl-tRNA synthetase [Candidatus Kinetoplastibacterium blastocrithidii TCC012E]
MSENNNILNKIIAIRGMNDILPPDSADWEYLEKLIIDWLHSYGYVNLRVPLLEHTRLFERGIGSVTDIVEKEMYSFVDSLNGECLTIRPEITAGIVRASIEHNFAYKRSRRVYSIGPVFRHERPQAGRYRQFNQVDVETIGFTDPDIDAELIIMVSSLWKKLGLNNIHLELNSIGLLQDRIRYKQELVSFFEKNIDCIDNASRSRLYSNPLRILDSKNPEMRSLIIEAPNLFNFLSDSSINHFEKVCSFLDEAGVKYNLNNRLVRGLDYYNLTVFEWISNDLGSQGTVCGGGRYDGLIESLGGKQIPAAGFAIGFERLIEIWKKTNTDKDYIKSECDVYIMHDSLKSQLISLKISEQLRNSGFSVILHSGRDSFRRQFKIADSCGALIAVIFGENEIINNSVSVKNLRQYPNDIFKEQEIMPIENLESFLRKRLMK